MTSKLARFFAVFAFVSLTAACGSTEMTDRLEATYAVADFEIEGAERSRTAFKHSIVDGPSGISQTFTAVDGVSPAEVFDTAVAAAEADGWELQPSQVTPSDAGVVAYRPVSGRETCDALRIHEPFDRLVLVKLQETRCR